MPRDKNTARRRLEQAALDLFVERGYDRTTATQIAQRAGVTERTFFHHFADKREALFANEADLGKRLADAVADAPAGIAPMDALCSAFTSLVPIMIERREFAQARHELVQSTPALHERETAKLAAFADALVPALRERAVPDQQAQLAASAAIAAFKLAVDNWYAEPSPGNLPEQIARAITDLRSVVGAERLP